MHHLLRTTMIQLQLTTSLNHSITTPHPPQQPLSNNATGSTALCTKPGAPLFFSLGGEGPESAAAVSGRAGLSWYAEQFSGLMVAAEHRFYGDSIPNNDVSLQNLQYLTTTQSLADYAALITNITTTLALPANTPVIAVGGSYSGVLSAFLHLKYPTIVHGSLASSAPVHAQLDFPEYLLTVQHSLGPQCTALISNATRLMETLLTTPAQRVYLARIFNVCEGDIANELDAAMFFGNALNPITALVQYNTNYRTINITSACEYMSEIASQSNALTALVRFNEWYNTAENNTYPFASGSECQNVSYSGYLNYMANDHSADRQWFYQTCREVGFAQVAEDGNYTTINGELIYETAAFSRRYVSLEFWLRQCYDLFNFTGEQVSANVDGNNAEYGGWHIRTNYTIFSNGLIDPWHTMSVINTTQLPNNDQSEVNMNLVNVIGPTSHCQDIGYPRATDIEALQTGRYRNINQIQLWLTGSPYPSSTGGGSGGGSGGTGGDGGGGSGGRSSMSSGAVVGIVVFAVLIGVVALAAALWWWRKRKVNLGGGGSSYSSGNVLDDRSLSTGYSSLLGGDGRAS